MKAEFKIQDPSGKVVATRATRAEAEQFCEIADRVALAENKRLGYTFKVVDQPRV